MLTAAPRVPRNGVIPDPTIPAETGAEGFPPEPPEGEVVPPVVVVALVEPGFGSTVAVVAKVQTEPGR